MFKRKNIIKLSALLLFNVVGLQGMTRMRRRRRRVQISQTPTVKPTVFDDGAVEKLNKVLADKGRTFSDINRLGFNSTTASSSSSLSRDNDSGPKATTTSSSGKKSLEKLTNEPGESIALSVSQSTELTDEEKKLIEFKHYGIDVNRAQPFIKLLVKWEVLSDKLKQDQEVLKTKKEKLLKLFQDRENLIKERLVEIFGYKKRYTPEYLEQQIGITQRGINAAEQAIRQEEDTVVFFGKKHEAKILLKDLEKTHKFYEIVLNKKDAVIKYLETLLTELAPFEKEQIDAWFELKNRSMVDFGKNYSHSKVAKILLKLLEPKREKLNELRKRQKQISINFYIALYQKRDKVLAYLKQLQNRELEMKVLATTQTELSLDEKKQIDAWFELEDRSKDDFKKYSAYRQKQVEEMLGKYSKRKKFYHSKIETQDKHIKKAKEEAAKIKEQLKGERGLKFTEEKIKHKKIQLEAFQDLLNAHEEIKKKLENLKKINQKESDFYRALYQKRDKVLAYLRYLQNQLRTPSARATTQSTDRFVPKIEIIDLLKKLKDHKYVKYNYNLLSKFNSIINTTDLNLNKVKEDLEGIQSEVGRYAVVGITDRDDQRNFLKELRDVINAVDSELKKQKGKSTVTTITTSSVQSKSTLKKQKNPESEVKKSCVVCNKEMKKQEQVVPLVCTNKAHDIVHGERFNWFIHPSCGKKANARNVSNGCVFCVKEVQKVPYRPQIIVGDEECAVCLEESSGTGGDELIPLMCKDHGLHVNNWIHRKCKNGANKTTKKYSGGCILCRQEDGNNPAMTSVLG